MSVALRYSAQQLRQPVGGRSNLILIQATRGKRPIRIVMFSFSCCSRSLQAITRAAAKSATAKLRSLGAGSTHPKWVDRALACERCPLQRIVKGVSYCGEPFLRQIHRDDAVDGCGCPTRAKAKALDEHGPIDLRTFPAEIHDGQCTCKWCALERSDRDRSRQRMDVAASTRS
jgi:hypothetical protein